MNEVQTFLQTKKTHLLVMGLIGVTVMLDLDTPEGIDLETAKTVLFEGLISTGKAAFDRWAAKE